MLTSLLFLKNGAELPIFKVPASLIMLIGPAYDADFLEVDIQRTSS